MEGYALFLLTTFGEPEPWSPQHLQVLFAMVRNEMQAPGVYAYSYKRKVWAQKPHDTEPKVGEKAEVETMT